MHPLAGKRIYLDANLFIYLLESRNYPDHKVAVEQVFGLIDSGGAAGVTSELTLGEALPVPLRTGDDALVASYREIFTRQSRLEVAAIVLAVIDAAAVLRAHSSLRMPDALHVATAMQHNCDIFLTNDAKLKVPEGLPLQMQYLSGL